MKKLFIIGTVMFNLSSIHAQIDKKLLIENFTNTNCSACASRMPGFYNNIKGQTQIVQVAYHPSSPYPSCKLNQHNKTENDGRANFYGVYGSTPLLVVDGANIGNVVFSNPSIYDTKISQKTFIQIKISQEMKGDSVENTVVFKKVSASTQTNFTANVILTEDTIFYNAPNGEKQHYNVFRKTIRNQSIQLTNIGDSTIIKTTTAFHSEWVKDRVKTVAWATETNNKTPLQAESQGFLKKSSAITLDSVYKSYTVSSLTNNNEEITANPTLTVGKEYTWIVKRMGIPQDWSFVSVCDNSTCIAYSQGVSNTFIASGMPKDDFLKVDIMHNKKAGYGFVELELTEKNNSSAAPIIQRFGLKVTGQTASLISIDKKIPFIKNNNVLSFDKAETKGPVEVLNLWGNIVLTLPKNQNEISIEHLSAGIYFVQIQNEIYKIIK